MLVAMRRLVLLVVASTTLLSCTPQETSRPVSSPTPMASTQIVYGPAPTNCPSGLQPEILSPSMPPVLGRAPLWATGFARMNPAPVPRSRFPPSPRGVGFKVYWVMLKGTGEEPPVHVTVTDISSRSSAWFTFAGRSEGIEAVFDPAHPAVEASPDSAEPRALGWPSTVSITHPGCYEIRASWSSGEWRTVFAAGTNGRVPDSTL